MADDLSPSLYVDTDSFYSPVISGPIIPDLFTNSNTFFTPIIGIILFPDLFVNSNTFYVPTINIGISPSLFTDPDTFLVPEVKRWSVGSASANSSASGVSASYTRARGISTINTTVAGVGASYADAVGKSYTGAIALATSNFEELAVYFLAWVPENTPWSGAVVRQDETIFAVEVSHNEGDFATLTIDVLNPRVGLLAAGRNLWAWLTWRDGTTFYPLLYGRIIGVPQNLHNEIVQLKFLARPNDYNTIKSDLAETLKEPPYWDQIWFDVEETTPDDVLEARTAFYHIDRITHEVTISDIVLGEDGSIEVSNHFYDSLKVEYENAPLRRINVKATVSWTQEGTADIDLTRELVAAFQAAGSPMIYPMISSLTSDGLFDEWPAPGDSISSYGWTISENSSITAADWMGAPIQTFIYAVPRFDDITVVDQPGEFVFTVRSGWQWQPAKTTAGSVLSGYDKYGLNVPLGIFSVNFVVTWTASRQRTEVLSFTVEADVQSILVDPGDAEEETLSLTSDFVGEPIELDGSLPIQDLRRNSYFKTDRGIQSFENILMMAKAKLVSSARAVNITFEMPWVDGISLSCRKNIILYDDRLPEGVAVGKIKSYKLVANGEGKIYCSVTIGCTVGYGTVLEATTGTGVYVEDGVLEPGIQAMTGQQIAVGANPSLPDILYDSFDTFIVEDDGVDLLNMSANTCLLDLTVTDGPIGQRQAITSGVLSPGDHAEKIVNTSRNGRVTILYGDVGLNQENDPSAILDKHPTVVSMELKSISSSSFKTEFSPTVSVLSIPQTINLEADPL